MNKKTNLITDNDNTLKVNQLKETCFERAIFFSWACKIEDCCKCCFMSTLPRERRTKESIRSLSSLLAETIISKELGWDYGFLSGGLGVLSDEQILEILNKTNIILGEKIWVNIGVLNKHQMGLYKPYIKGVVGTIETLGPELHKKVFPSKPIAPVEKMFEEAKELGLERGMTLIIGIGETIEDFKMLKAFIEKHRITKIHVYGLNPQKGTIFEKTNPPSAEYQAEWIRKIREAFPGISLQAGIWIDRVNYVRQLLEAGANSVSKFPAIRYFGSKAAKEIEAESLLAGRRFRGTLTKIPEVIWDSNVDMLPFDEKLKSEIKKKLNAYLKTMMKH